MDVGVLPAEASLALLGRIAGAGRVQAQPEAAAVVAGQCGHLPLALRVAGARSSWKCGQFPQVDGLLERPVQYELSTSVVAPTDADVCLCSLLTGFPFSVGLVPELVGLRRVLDPGSARASRAGSGPHFPGRPVRRVTTTDGRL